MSTVLGYSIDLTRREDGTWDVGAHWTLEGGGEEGDISCNEALQVFSEADEIEPLLKLIEEAISLHSWMYDKGAFDAGKEPE